MNLLALDTATEQGSVALARDGKLLEVRPLPPGWRSTTLHAEIARLLDLYGLTTRDLDGYGVTSGPGAFTGVRLGLTAVKGLAEVYGKPVVPVSTLETITVAARIASPLPSLRQLAAILDARRGQIFGGVYCQQDDGWMPAIDEMVGPISSFLGRIKSSPKMASQPVESLAFCGIELAPFVPEIQKAGWSGAAMLEVSPLLAGPLARIARCRLQKNAAVDASRADANYVRLSDAELFWKE